MQAEKRVKAAECSPVSVFVCMHTTTASSGGRHGAGSRELVDAGRAQAARSTQNRPRRHVRRIPHFPGRGMRSIKQSIIIIIDKTDAGLNGLCIRDIVLISDVINMYNNY